jgi:hypothetical protein
MRLATEASREDMQRRALGQSGESSTSAGQPPTWSAPSSGGTFPPTIQHGETAGPGIAGASSSSSGQTFPQIIQLGEAPTHAAGSIQLTPLPARPLSTRDPRQPISYTELSREERATVRDLTIKPWVRGRNRAQVAKAWKEVGVEIERYVVKDWVPPANALEDGVLQDSGRVWIRYLSGHGIPERTIADRVARVFEWDEQTAKEMVNDSLREGASASSSGVRTIPPTIPFGEAPTRAAGASLYTGPDVAGPSASTSSGGTLPRTIQLEETQDSPLAPLPGRDPQQRVAFGKLTVEEQNTVYDWTVQPWTRRFNRLQVQRAWQAQGVILSGSTLQNWLPPKDAVENGALTVSGRNWVRRLSGDPTTRDRHTTTRTIADRIARVFELDERTAMELVNDALRQG